MAALQMTAEMKRAGDFMRGFMRASSLSAAELAGLYLVLALEQAERASVGVALTLDVWREAAAVAWLWRSTDAQ